MPNSFVSYTPRMYASVDQYKDLTVFESDTHMHDSRIEFLLRMATRDIEVLTGNRQFLPYYATYKYDYPRGGKRLWLYRDLLEVVEMSDYQGVISASDYTLYPQNGPLMPNPTPYAYLDMDTTRRSFYYQVTTQNAVTLNGKWGFCDTRESLGTVLTETLDETTTDFEPNQSIGASVGDCLAIGSEFMIVTATDPSGLVRVVRGVHGSEASEHLQSIPVYRVHPPEPIRYATCILAARGKARAAAGFADVAGSPLEGMTYFKALPAEVMQIVKYYATKLIEMTHVPWLPNIEVT